MRAKKHNGSITHYDGADAHAGAAVVATKFESGIGAAGGCAGMMSPVTTREWGSTVWVDPKKHDIIE